MTYNEGALFLMRQLQKILDQADSHEMVIPTLELTVIVAQKYPLEFDSQFCEFVDLLVGWSVDPDVGLMLEDEISGMWSTRQYI